MHEIDRQRWYTVNAALTVVKSSKEMREHAHTTTPHDFKMPKAGTAFYLLSSIGIKGTMNSMKREFFLSPSAARDRLAVILTDRYLIQDYEPAPFVDSGSALRENKSNDVFFMTDLAHKNGYASLENAMTNRRTVAVYDPLAAANLVSKNPGTFIAEFAIDGVNPQVLWPQWRHVLYSSPSVECGEVVAEEKTRFDIVNLFVGTEANLSRALFFVPIDGMDNDQLMLF